MGTRVVDYLNSSWADCLMPDGLMTGHQTKSGIQAFRHSVTTMTSHPTLCTPSRVYTQLCSPWTCPIPTRSTSRPFFPLSSPLHALCSICDAYISAHDVMLLPSDLREHHWPIANTHNQMQIMELAPKLMRASATPRTHVHTRALPPLLTISLCSSFVIILASLVPGLTSVP